MDRDLHDIDRSKRSGARRGIERDESIQRERETSGERAPAIHRRTREEEAAADPKIPARLRGMGAERGEVGVWNGASLECDEEGNTLVGVRLENRERGGAREGIRRRWNATMSCCCSL